MRHSYEFGDATVIVRVPNGAIARDGIVREIFQTEVHPADGSRVFAQGILAFYPWDAANQALKNWKEGGHE